MKLPPYQNKGLSNLPGEKWGDIPYVDGYYLVSNFGRIKRTERISINKTGRQMLYEELIISPRVLRARNNYVGDETYHLCAHFAIDGRKYHLSIRRLVYHCFVNSINLHDKTITIIHKDGDGFNLKADNLKLLSRKQATLRIFQRNRKLPEFVAEAQIKGVAASLEKTCREVTQYNSKGKKVKTFSSIMEASRQTGISHGQIQSAACGREQSAWGYFWKYGNAGYFDVKSFVEKRKRGYIEKKGTKVTQYDKDGNKIAQFMSLQEAAKAVGGHSTGISAAIRGVMPRAFGFVWKRGWGKEKIKIKNYERKE